MPIGMITLAQAAGPQRVGRVMSVVGVPMLLGPVLGPVIGGLIVTHLSWRWIFLVNLPIGLVGLVLAARLLPRGRAEGLRSGPARLDWRGLLALSPGVALVVFGLSEISTHGSVAPAGLVARRRDDADRRCVHVHLTGNAHARVRRKRERVARRRSELFEALSPGERREAARLLSSLAAAIEELR